MIRLSALPPDASRILEANISTGSLIDLHERATFRGNYIKEYGFTYLTKAWVGQLLNVLKGKRVLEVMAGTGALASVLKSEGVDINVTDNKSWKSSSERWNTQPHIPIEELDAVAAIKKYDKVDYIIMSWPPYDSPIAYMVLMTKRICNPNAIIIYIGEGYGGCTADDDFHDNYTVIDRAIYTGVNANYQAFDGIWDRIEFCK